jgi:hypothetical protein
LRPLVAMALQRVSDRARRFSIRGEHDAQHMAVGRISDLLHMERQCGFDSVDG